MIKLHVTGVGDAFHVTSDVPLSAYDISPYGGALSFLPSASLLFPATSWGQNHMSIGPAPTNSPTFALVVAREDNTIIKVAPANDFPGGGGQPCKAHRFLRIHGTACVRQNQVTIRIDEFEDVGEGILAPGKIGAAQRHRHQFRSRGRQRIAHGLRRRKFASPEKESGLEGATGNHEWFRRDRKSVV